MAKYFLIGYADTIEKTFIPIARSFRKEEALQNLVTTYIKDNHARDFGLEIHGLVLVDGEIKLYSLWNDPDSRSDLEIAIAHDSVREDESFHSRPQMIKRILKEYYYELDNRWKETLKGIDLHIKYRIERDANLRKTYRQDKKENERIKKILKAEKCDYKEKWAEIEQHI